MGTAGMEKSGASHATAALGAQPASITSGPHMLRTAGAWTEPHTGRPCPHRTGDGHASHPCRGPQLCLQPLTDKPGRRCWIRFLRGSPEGSWRTAPRAELAQHSPRANALSTCQHLPRMPQCPFAKAGLGLGSSRSGPHHRGCSNSALGHQALGECLTRSTRCLTCHRFPDRSCSPLSPPPVGPHGDSHPVPTLALTHRAPAGTLGHRGSSSGIC